MTVNQLRCILDEFDPDDEVRIMMQPEYPFEYSIASSVFVSDPDERHENPNAFTPRHIGQDVRVIYLLEKNQIGYGTRKMWD
jgi:hypothetical protein